MSKLIESIQANIRKRQMDKLLGKPEVKRHLNFFDRLLGKPTLTGTMEFELRGHVQNKPYSGYNAMEVK